MANILYTQGLSILVGAGSWTADVLRVLLVRSTSAYTANKDHNYLSEFASGGGVEVTVASYARQTLGTKTNTIDDDNDRVELGCATVNFGNLESGQTVLGVIGYRQVGGDDTTPADDDLLFYIDTDAGGVLPASLGGGAFTITINAEGLIQFGQAA